MVQGVQGDAEHVTAGAKVKSLETVLTSYKMSNLTYPTQEQGLDALVTRPTAEPKPKRWTQLLKPDGITDPWGRKMVYRNPGKHNDRGYDVLSLGADGLENTKDDIGNW